MDNRNDNMTSVPVQWWLTFYEDWQHIVDHIASTGLHQNASLFDRAL